MLPTIEPFSVSENVHPEEPTAAVMYNMLQNTTQHEMLLVVIWKNLLQETQQKHLIEKNFQFIT